MPLVNSLTDEERNEFPWGFTNSRHISFHWHEIFPRHCSNALILHPTADSVTRFKVQEELFLSFAKFYTHDGIWLVPPAPRRGGDTRRPV